MPQTEVRVFRSSPETVPLLEWLDELSRRQPKAYFKCLARVLALAELGHELRRPAADLLTGGIYELRVRHANVNYRMLYFFCGVHVACLSHGFTKESAVPPAEIELAAARKKLVAISMNRYTANFEDLV